MPETMNPEEFNQAMIEIRKITEYRNKKRSKWLPRKPSSIYWFWMAYLLAFGIGGILVPPDRVQVLLFAVLAILFRHLAELHRDRSQDIWLNATMMTHVGANLIRENEALTEANLYLRNQLAERDS